VNFGVWWDADPLRELLDGIRISKWDPEAGTPVTLLEAAGAAANNGSKGTPALSADILGDWREEVIWRAADNASLRIYTTTIPARSRMATLVHDPQYRVAVAWQNVGYNQPPHPGFFIGEGMKPPGPRRIAVPLRGGRP
jgi:rhamnogalacturonan endolyase